MKAPIFAKIDKMFNDFFTKRAIAELEKQEQLLEALLRHDRNLIQGLDIIQNRLKEERAKCNIIA